MIKKTIKNMDNYELSRWYALIEAVDLIDSTCETLNKDFDTIHLNSIAIKEFINDTALKFERDLDSEPINNKNNINNLIINSLFNNKKINNLDTVNV